MPRITLQLVDDNELQAVEEAISVVSGAVTHCDAQLTVVNDGSNGQPAAIVHTITAPQYYRKHIDDAFQTVNSMLQQGKIAIAYSKHGSPKLEIATKTIVSDYPVAHMNPDEEQLFQDAILAVNTGIMSRHCHFESFLDQQAMIFFRYRIEDHAPNRDNLFQHIHRIIEAVNDGTALRVELPDGAVMLMPRWKLGQNS